MKRTRFARRGGMNRDAELLARLATGLAASASRMEDGFWEVRLAEVIDRLLRTGNEETLSVALDHLHGAAGRAYDELADLIESRAEGGMLGADGRDFDVAMFAAPVLAWSRFVIPSGALPAGLLAAAQAQLQGHVLAAGARLALADFLYSPDQLPRGFVETWRLANLLSKAAVAERTAHIDPQQLPETTRFVSDTRYLIGAVAVPRGQALFRWQEDDGSREQADAQWRAQGGPALAPHFTGCAFEMLLPEVYHGACRNADRSLRGYSLHAAAAFLETTLNVRRDELHATLAPFGVEHAEEYRIGFTIGDAGEVVHGVVWPLLGAEDDGPETVAQIETALRESGVGGVIILDHRFPPEFCDDCGMPMFPTPEGETSHAELPEDGPQAPAHLH